MNFSIVKFFFLAGLFLLPFIFWPWADIQYELPRVWFVQRWIEILGIIGIAGGIWWLKKKSVDFVLVLLIFGFALAVFISSYLGVDFNKSFGGNFYRGDGLFTLFHLAGFFFFLALFWKSDWRKPVAIAIAAGSFLLSLWTLFLGIRLYIFGDLSVSSWNGALGTTFGQPNFLAGYLLVTLPFLAYLATTSDNQRFKTFWLRALVLQILAIFPTFAWGAVLGIPVFLAGWLILRKGVFFWKLLAISALIITVSGASYLVWQNKPKFALDSTGTILVAHPESRERILVKGFLAFQTRPIWGWGYANFDYAFDSVIWPIKLPNDVYVDKGHSVLFELLVTTGVVGLGMYLVLVGWVVLRQIRGLFAPESEGRTWNKTILLVFILYLFHSQTNVISIGEELMFWLVLGIVCSRKM